MYKFKQLVNKHDSADFAFSSESGFIKLFLS